MVTDRQTDRTTTVTLTHAPRVNYTAIILKTGLPRKLNPAKVCHYVIDVLNNVIVAHVDLVNYVLALQVLHYLLQYS